MVIVSEQFARDLADAVDGRGLHDRILRSSILGRRGAESTDRRGGKQRAVMLAGHLERVVERPHVDVPSHLGIALADGRQQGHEVEDRIDVVTGHHRSHGRRVEGVQHLERSVLGQRPALAHVGGHDVRTAVDPAQKNCQLGTDLASGAYYQDTFHLHFIMIRK